MSTCPTKVTQLVRDGAGVETRPALFWSLSPSFSSAALSSTRETYTLPACQPQAKLWTDRTTFSPARKDLLQLPLDN